MPLSKGTTLGPYEIVRGVSGSYYHSADLHICAKYGIQLAIGDTAGSPGMMMGLRSIPAHIDICRRMEKRCPDVVFLNHSNPMATIMRALHKYTGIKSYGLCHGVQEELPYNMADSARRHGFDASDPMPTKQEPTPELRSSFLADYQMLLDETQLPEVKEDSRSGEGPAQIITAMATGQRMVCIVNTANNGSIPNLPPTAEVEVEVVTETRGARALVMGEAPMVLKGILEKRFVWQELVADAAVHGDRNKAMQAMMVDEMAIEPARAQALLDELLLASRDLLPNQFFN